MRAREWGETQVGNWNCRNSKCVRCCHNSSNIPRTSKCFFEIFFYCCSFSENNDLDFDAKLSNFFSGKPLGVWLPSIFHPHCGFSVSSRDGDIKQFLDLYSQNGLKAHLVDYKHISAWSSINDRCFCLTVHKSTLVVNEASMERLLNLLLPSFYLGYTSHYWILWKK